MGDGSISENQQVWIELTKADGSTSEPTEFLYTPGGGPVPGGTGPKQVELSRRVESVPTTQSKPVNMYNGGSVTNIKSERKIKVERAEAEQTSWAAMVNGVNHIQQGPRPVVAPYSTVVPTNGGGLVLGNNVQFTSPMLFQGRWSVSSRTPCTRQTSATASPPGTSSSPAGTSPLSSKTVQRSTSCERIPQICEEEQFSGDS